MSLVIGGMTCGACAARIEQRLNLLDGVEARVNYASERATATLPRRRSRGAAHRRGRRRRLHAPSSRRRHGRGPEERGGGRRRAGALAAPAPVRGRPALHAAVRHVDRLLRGAQPALHRLAVADDGPGGAGGDLGGVAVLPGRRARGPPPHVDHGHPGLAGHRGLHGVVALRHVLARHQPGAAVHALHAGAPLGRGHLPRRGRRRHDLRAGRALFRGVVPAAVGQRAARPGRRGGQGRRRDRPAGVRAPPPGGRARRGRPLHRPARGDGRHRRRGRLRPVGGRPQRPHRGVAAARCRPWATSWWGAPSRPAGGWSCAPPRSAATRSWRRCSGWSSTPRTRRRPCSAWPTGCATSSCPPSS